MACDANNNPVANVELTINGNNVELNRFLQNFIAETLMGMVKSLRDVKEAETIELKITKN